MLSESDRLAAESAVLALINAVHPQANEETLENTPGRVVRMFEEMLSGTGISAETPLRRAFPIAGAGTVHLQGIQFISVCEHHLLPFFGQVDVAYQPGIDCDVVGLSKIPRSILVLSRRLQLQERFTVEIGEAIMGGMAPTWASVRVVAQHGCVMWRGVKQPMTVTTSCERGDLSDPSYGEFIRRGGLGTAPIF